jgi:hypothetical protein
VSYHNLSHLVARKAALFEAALFHGSRREFPVGFILSPQSDGYVQDPETKRTEEIVERYRPTGKIARHKAVFLVDDPDLIDSAGGYTDFIYTVEPIGRVERSDLSWYSDIEIYLDTDESEQQRLAENYWSGMPYNEGDHSLFEYRVKSAKIVAVERGDSA